MRHSVERDGWGRPAERLAALVTALVVLALGAAGCASTASDTRKPAPSPSPSVDEASRPARAILNDAATAASGLRSYRAVFKGLDGDGPLSFDLMFDGHGGVSGSYTKHGLQGTVLLVGTTLYVRGRELVTAFNGQKLPPAYEGRWIQYRTRASAGLLDTLRRPELFADCLRRSGDSVSSGGASQLGSLPVVALDASADRVSWHVQVSVSLDGAPLPVRLSILASQRPPASCTGGATDNIFDPARPAAGTIGTLDITPGPPVPTVTPPADVAQLPSSGP